MDYVSRSVVLLGRFLLTHIFSNKPTKPGLENNQEQRMQGGQLKAKISPQSPSSETVYTLHLIHLQPSVPQDIACVCAKSSIIWPCDQSSPGSSVHGILQARIPERVVISSSRGSSWPWDGKHISCIACRIFTSEPPGNLPQVIRWS